MPATTHGYTLRFNNQTYRKSGFSSKEEARKAAKTLLNKKANELIG
jgi:hypothetical protein